MSPTDKEWKEGRPEKFRTRGRGRGRVPLMKAEKTQKKQGKVKKREQNLPKAEVDERQQ